MKIIPHVCPQKWQGNFLRFTVSVFQSVTDPDCTRYPKKLLLVSDCWKLSICKGNNNLELLRLFAFSVNIIHILGQQKAWAIFGKIEIFFHFLYEKIEENPPEKIAGKCEKT